MPTALTRSDVGKPRTLRRWIRPLVVLVAGLGLAAALIAAEESMPASAFCEPPEPDCGPDWVGASIFGLHLGLLGIACLHLFAAAALAWLLALAAVTAQVVDPWYPDWVPVLFVGYALIVTLVSAHAAAESRRVAASASPVAPLDPLPVGRLPLIRARWFATGLLALGAGAGVLAWGLHVQARETAREADADVVVGMIETVDENEYKLTVVLDGEDRSVKVPVDYAETYGVGSNATFYVGEDLVRPVREPYDVAYLGALAAVLFAIGVAAAARGMTANLGMRRLLRRPQPMRAVRARLGHEEVAVYAHDARGSDDPVLTIPVLPARDPSDPRWPWAADDSGDNTDDGVDDPSHQGEVFVPVVDATLVGTPAVGTWATVVVNGYVLVPSDRARPGHSGPPAGDIGTILEAELTFGPGDEQHLHPVDAAAHPLEPQQERRNARAGYLSLAFPVTAAIAGIAIGALWQAHPFALLAVAFVGLASVELIWRTDVAPQASWDSTSVTITRAGPPRRFAWTDVEAIDGLDHMVIVTARDGRDAYFNEPRRSLARRFSPHPARTATQLWAALRRTRSAALAASPNELAAHPLAVPNRVSRPWLMYIAIPFAAALALLLR